VTPGLASRPVAGRYVLLDELGVGASGAVWRAWDLRRQRVCAAKVLGQHHSALLQRFVREQATRVDHPHVVAPTGWAADDDVVVLTMDLVSGGSVDDLRRREGPLPEAYVAVLLDQLLQALAAVHAAGVVHRDVKPANLLLEPTGRARPHLRLADFGVAATPGDARLTVVPGGIGTPGYMAPEQEAGAPPDPRQDLYAAGRVAARLLGPAGSAYAADRLLPVLAALTAPDRGDRPASAAQARVQLRRLGIAEPTSWPEVPDTLAGRTVPVSALRVSAVPVSAARQLPAVGAGSPGRGRRRASPALAGAVACFGGAIGLSAAALARVVG